MVPKLIACRAVWEQVLPFLPPEMSSEVLEISLHVHPGRLQERIQQAIDAADGLYDPIYLGYGMCSRALIGLSARKSRLVAPKSDDCIEMFLGSREARLAALASEPGTYFVTQGSLGEGFGSAFPDYERAVSRYGSRKAGEMLRAMMRNYQFLAYIRMPRGDGLERDRATVREMAERFDLQAVEVEGAAEWLGAMFAGQWDGRFVVMEPGHAIERRHFAAG
jgi:hypothetical protein